MKVTTDIADGINRSTANYVAGIMGRAWQPSLCQAFTEAITTAVLQNARGRMC